MPEQIEKAEIIETLGTEAVVTSELMVGGRYRVSLRTMANRKNFRSLTVSSGGKYYSHRYLSWAYHFKSYSEPVLFDMVMNDRLLAAKCNGQVLLCREDVEAEAEKLKAKYSVPGTIFDYRIKKAKVVPSDEYSDSDSFGVFALFRDGSIDDYFNTGEVLAVLERNGVCAEMFEEPLSELFSRPISELITEDLNGFELQAAPFGLGYSKVGDSFTLQEFFQTDIQFIAGRILQGDPLEGIAAEIAVRNRQRA